jgi:hypothetical protein
MHALPADLIKNPVFRLVPLKGARAWKTRAMVDRYAEDMADQRALEAKAAQG